MPAPWSETPTRVVVEFLRTSRRGRHIELKHTPQLVPAQLQGRIDPKEWAAFMTEVQQMAAAHPYVVRPNADKWLHWMGAAVVGAVIGIFRIDPDGGDYSVWLQQVQQLVTQYQPAFQAGGADVSVQRAQASYWIQIDVDPTAMAVGQPVVGYSPPNFIETGEPVKPALKAV